MHPSNHKDMQRRDVQTSSSEGGVRCGLGLGGEGGREIKEKRLAASAVGERTGNVRGHHI